MKFTKGRALFLGILVVAAALVYGAWLSFPGPRSSYQQWLNGSIQSVFEHPFFHLGTLPITLTLILEVVLFMLALGFVTGRMRVLLQNRILTRTHLNPGQRYAFARVASYLIFVLGLIIGLQSSGLNLNSLLVVGGAVGIGIGLGIQHLANNFVSGLVLLFEQPVRMGDRVEVGGVLGDVVKMAARSVWIRTNENVVIIVPNSEFTSNRVTNWTANDRLVRFSIPLGVSYDSDPEKVREIVLRVALNHPDVLGNPAPEFLFLDFGDSSLDFELRVWTETQMQTPKILSSDLYFSIFQAFRENGIEIPFPQRDLHLKSISGTIPVSTA